MSVENIYTSIGCNRTTECADWGKNGFIVFGACNAVAIYDAAVISLLLPILTNNNLFMVFYSLRNIQLK